MGREKGREKEEVVVRLLVVKGGLGMRGRGREGVGGKEAMVRIIIVSVVMVIITRA